MGQRLILHIGLMKSGTTSIQRALGAQRAHLEPQGVHYPDLGQDSQILSFVEILVADPVAFERFPTGLRRHVLETRAVWEGMFGALRELMDTDTTSRTVLSAENLIYAGPGSLDRLAAEFDPYDLRVVITHRRPSRALVSNYQQQARITLMPDVESWCRTQLAGLAADDDRISVASLRLDALTRRWKQLSPDVVLVDTDGEPEVSLLAMWDALAGVRPPERLDARVSNASLPHGFLVGVQSFQAENPTYSVARLRQAIAAALPRYRSQVSEDVPPPVLQHDVADLLDKAVADSTHARWIELERRLRDDSPVVRPQTETDARMERTLGALAHSELQRADRREAPRRVVRRLRAVRRR